MRFEIEEGATGSDESSSSMEGSSLDSPSDPDEYWKIPDDVDDDNENDQK